MYPDSNRTMQTPQTKVEVRVRYTDCDPMGVAHHSVYPVWLEIARTELLREYGVAYGDLEAQGIYFVVARMDLRYRQPARYDDVLRIMVKEVLADKPSRIKVDHQYEVRRENELLATASTTLVCVGQNKKPRAIPHGVLG